MAIALDGLRALRRIGKHPAVFAAARIDADKAARSIVTKVLKAKTTDLTALRALREALHDEPFALIVEGLKDADIKAVLLRLDSHHPDVKDGSPASRQRHLLALAAGEAEPTAASAEAKTTPRSAKPAGGKSRTTKAESTAPPPRRRFNSAVMEVFKQGGRDDE
jgi:hypothetical protein